MTVRAKSGARGSHATFGGWEPRVCVFGDRCVHGGQIHVTHDPALRFHHDDQTGKSTSWHYDCEKAHGWPLKEQT